MILIVCAAEELPDDYFTPTIADLKARQEQLRARATALNNSPLLTRAQREEQAKTKRDRWPNVRLPHSSHSFPWETCQKTHHASRSWIAVPSSFCFGLND